MIQMMRLIITRRLLIHEKYDYNGRGGAQDGRRGRQRSARNQSKSYTRIIINTYHYKYVSL